MKKTSHDDYLPLFDPPPVKSSTVVVSSISLSRSADPGTSHEAARDMVGSGAVGRMCEYAHLLLKRNPGSTARELDREYERQSGKKSDGSIRKRLNDLRKHGLARTEGSRRCEVSGKRANLWWVGSSGGNT